ncbi:MAG TPA: phosphate uptake regulator PhoU, partial [Archaeoglobus sp.]|nr:phosphate uptake regulator PhoU [Archaeoglobus sp.]
MELRKETRKIQLIGTSSYMISLPKKWITSLNLKQGDEVILHAQTDRIVVMPKKFEKSGIVRIIMRGIPSLDYDFLKRYIYAIYMLGFDEVILEDVEASPTLITKLSEIIQKLIGMEIIDVSTTRIVFRILVTPELDIESVLKRMVQMVSSMFDDAGNGITDRERLKNLIITEEMVDRFYWLAVRLENRLTRESASWGEIRYILGSRMVAKMIEDIADHLVKFGGYADDLSFGMDDTKSLVSEIQDVFKQSFNSFVNRDIISSEKIIECIEELQRKIVGKIFGSDDVKYSLCLLT